MTSVPPTDAELDELLDDAFEQFSIEPTSSTDKKTDSKKTPVAETQTTASSSTTGEAAGASSNKKADEDIGAKFQEEFAQQLAKGMEALLKDPSMLDGAPESQEDMQKTIDNLLKQLGTIPGAENEEAGSKNNSDGTNNNASAGQTARAASEEQGEAPASFQDKIKATMDKLKESADKAESGGRGSGSGGLGALEDMGMMDDLLRQMDNMGDDAQLDSLVDDVIGQLMSKEVLNQPLKDLDAAYPGYLEKNKDKIPKDEYERYQKQHDYIKQILVLFDESTDDEVNNPKIIELMQAMQDCGQPPAELLKILAPDMELNEKGEVKEPEVPNCSIM
ncbi:Peroxisome chaperone and import receptor [Coemansia sp. IMI 203386]|nr:Peroxisome chaperone and import receptor [Coemansia sp. IMI 203386]